MKAPVQMLTETTYFRRQRSNPCDEETALAFLANFLSASSAMQSCRKKSYAQSGVNRAAGERIAAWLEREVVARDRRG